MNLRGVESTTQFLAAGRPVAAACHGAQRLAATGLSKGRRRASAPPARQVEAEPAGAEDMGIAVDQAVADRNLVTASARPAPLAWIARLPAVLGMNLGV